MAKLNRKVDNEQQLQTLNFQVKESYKKARTSIAYSLIKKGCKKIIFTSAMKSEGKTLTSTNVAIALAQQVNTRVLIIECDLRRPRVHVALGLTPAPGLTNYLNDECSLDDILKPTNTPNLSAISYGVIPPNPSELLSSEAMEDMVKELESRFDYIIFDTPPINVVIDALPIIKLSDGVVLVIKNESTTHPELNKAVDLIRRSGGKILGVIINQVKLTDVKKDYYYRYQ